jgi:WD40 repeat protein
MRVISGHLGWVRCICVEPGNEWFATGAGDRTVKIWDLASGTHSQICSLSCLYMVNILGH